MNKVMNSIAFWLLLSYVLGVSVFIWSFVTLSHRASDSAQAKRALCALRDDLVRRLADGEEFLAKHPNGIPGISVNDIRRSLQSQRQTIDVLEPGLDC